MRRSPLARLLSAALVILMTAGGGRLSAVDGFLFHGRESPPDTFQTHVEASDGCHAEQCVIRSTPQPTRFTPSPATIAVVLAEPRVVVRPPSRLAPTSRSVARPSSRAPPAFSRV